MTKEEIISSVQHAEFVLHRLSCEDNVTLKEIEEAQKKLAKLLIKIAI